LVFRASGEPNFHISEKTRRVVSQFHKNTVGQAPFEEENPVNQRLKPMSGTVKFGTAKRELEFLSQPTRRASMIPGPLDYGVLESLSAIENRGE
jgi:hypothetical protein